MHRVLVVGYGEIGRPLFELVRGVYAESEWLDVEDKEVGIDPDVMHIAFPEQAPGEFVSASLRYIERFSPRLVLIESTVTPGTTLEIHKRLSGNVLLCHSPVRGNITEGMKTGLLQYTKFIGAATPDAGEKASEYYKTLGLKTYLCSSPIESELGKLFETTYRGIMMAWFQEMHRICKQFGADYEQVVEFVGSTGREGKQARPVFHPGVIGGHCIIPNAKKLRTVFPSKFAEALLDSNRRREEELKEQSK